VARVAARHRSQSTGSRSSAVSHGRSLHDYFAQHAVQRERHTPVANLCRSCPTPDWTGQSAGSQLIKHLQTLHYTLCGKRFLVRHHGFLCKNHHFDLLTPVLQYGFTGRLPRQHRCLDCPSAPVKSKLRFVARGFANSGICRAKQL
jgi:hypothetical protein